MKESTDRRNTRQRQVVLEAVRDLEGSHPTADRVYDQVRLDLPRISLSTVYRNLGILSEQGRIQPFRGAGPEVHYDCRTEDHCHAQCRVCGRVLDLPTDAIDHAVVRWGDADGFIVEEVVVTVVGTCTLCRGTAKDRREQP